MAGFYETDLLRVGQLLERLVHALLQNSNLFVLLITDTVDLGLRVVELDKKVVDLLLFRLQKTSQPLS